MKKLWAVVMLLGFATGAYASCFGPFCWDDTGPYINGTVAMQSYTLAQIQALSVRSAGVEVYCSDCKGAGNKGTVCISTGTGAYAFSLSTGTQCS